MGEFVSASAIYTQDAETVYQSIQGILSKKGVLISKVKSPEESKYHRYATVQKPINGWIVITWPAFFGVYEAKMAELLSVEIKRPVITAGIYDGDYWYQSVYENGKIADEFSSVPDYWSENEEARKDAISKQVDSAQKLTKYLNTTKEKISPYMVHAHKSKGKANDADRFELNDPWVFVDFWKVCGITYPESPDNSYVIMEFPDRWSNLLQR